MVDDILIRKAKLDDFENIHKIFLQVHELHLKSREDIFKDNTDPMNYNDFKDGLLNTEKLYFVAELKSNIVGICLCSIKIVEDNKYLKYRKILYINDICVDKKFRNQGIGKKMYEKVFQKAKELKCNSVELMVWGFNKNAIRFYKSLGMKVKNMKFEQFVD